MINLGECLDFGIKRLTKNPLFYIVGFLVVVLVGVALSMAGQGVSFVWGFFLGALFEVLGASQDTANICAGVSGLMISIIFGSLVSPFYVGYYKGIRKECQGMTAEVADVFSGFGCFITAVGSNLICSFLIFLGAVFCIIPGLIVWPLAVMTPYFLARGQCEGLTALGSAWRLLTTKPIIIVWFNVLGLFGVLGYLLCCVGGLCTMPIAMAGMCRLIDQALGEEPPALTAAPPPVA